jgi:ornithine carbamoyltransferase
MVSMIVARVNDHTVVEGLAEGSTVPVINALSSLYHPLQALADILTIQENYPQGMKGLKVAWVGDATNVLYDLAIAGVKMGMNIAAATPKKYPFNDKVLKVVKQNAQDGATIELTTDPLEAIKDADIIVTDTWYWTCDLLLISRISMGQESEKAQRLKDFAGYQVTTEMANKGGAKKDWKFMHCLPRKPEEVSDEVPPSNFKNQKSYNL